MLKYEFYNEEKNIIRHNLVPDMFIEVIKLDRPNDYEGADLSFDDIFDENFIKGWHFVFKIMNDGDFQNIEDFSHIRSVLKRAGKWYHAKVAIGEIKLKKYRHKPSPLEDDSFKLVESDCPSWWLIAHKESSIIIEFQHGDFNGSQKVSELSTIRPDFMQIARILREVGEWLAINHPDKI